MSIFAYAIRLLLLTIWHRPFRVLAGGIIICLAGITFGMGMWWTYSIRKPIERRQIDRPRSVTSILTRPGTLLLSTALLFSLTDWALLWALPLLRLSFATDSEMLLPLFASMLIRLLLLWSLAATRLIARSLLRARKKRGTHQGPSNPTARAYISPTVLLFLAINLAFSIVQIDAYVVEPQWVQTTELSLSFDRLDQNAPPVRVVHLTDLHIERSSYREKTIIRKVNALQPDIIVFTGDYLNLSRLSDPTSAAHFRQFVSQLEAPHGIYAVRGTVEPSLESMAWLVQGTNVTWLEQEVKIIDVRGQQVALVGIACSHNSVRDIARLDKTLARSPGMANSTGNAFTLLLYHSPDLILEAADRQIDLYLSGHTHGGQLRLPFIGPLVTGSKYGPRYAAGLFQAPSDHAATGSRGGTWMYNSRGLGLEGGVMPRARFLCPPEIVSIELGGH